MNVHLLDKTPQFQTAAAHNDGHGDDGRTLVEIAFWDYLGDRLAIPGAHTVPRLPEIILARAQSP